MALIRNGELIPDSYIPVSDSGSLPATGDLLLSLSRCTAEKRTLADRPSRVGVRVPPGTSLAEVAPLIKDVQLFAIEFPSFTDGRGYSLARRLRTQLGFTGEIRAVGEVLRDQLYYMRRCGFDAFEIKVGKDASDALEAFRELSVAYQGAADDPRPLFRRRCQPV